MEKSRRAWRKSTYSGATSANCVEVASGTGRVLVRDTQAPETVALTVPATTWRSFTRSLKQ